ncbi:MAG: peptidoglycan-binding protein LysM [Myxococcota bacterium]
MGMFSFVKSAGRKLGMFGGSEAAEAEKVAKAALAATQQVASSAEKVVLERKAVSLDIRAAIQSHGIVIRDLDVSFDGEAVTLTGTATAQIDKEKAVLIAGNTEGVGAVQDDLAVEIPAPPAIHHTVVKGDTLSKIALVQYGNMQLFDHIFEANKPMLDHPDKIYPGQVLRIPRLANASHTVAKGDTLGKIAKFYYGDAKRYTDIFEANRGSLANPDAIEVGQRLVIPLAGPAVDPTVANS